MKFDYAAHIEPYRAWGYYADDNGFIVWRRATGANVELFHIDADEPRHGVGRRLLRAMLRRLKADPPYATVFGFCRVGNKDAQAFYWAMGFDLTEVTGVYADGAAVVFSQEYRRLCELHLTEPEGGKP